jgi:DNA invertase Pin-like site-specific DNA recombinase
MSVCEQDFLPTARIIVMAASDETRVVAMSFCDQCIASGRAMIELRRLFRRARKEHPASPEPGCEKTIPAPPEFNLSLKQQIRRIILDVVDAHGGRVRAAAKVLKVSPDTVYRVLRKAAGDGIS